MEVVLCLYILSCLFTSSVQAIACYTPNGEDRNHMFGYDNLEDYAPCNAGANHSMCCAWGSARQSAGSADVCQSNGLCKNGNNLWRESCTDPTWQDPACIKLFVNGTGFNNTAIVYDGSDPITDVTVTSCPDGSFCYGTNNNLCCLQGQGFFVNAEGEATTNNPASVTSSSSTSTSTSSTASSSSSPTTSIQTAASSTASPTSTPIASGSGGLSTGAQAGIGAGVGVAALIAIAIGAWFFLRRRKNRKQQYPSEMAEPHPRPQSQFPASELPAGGSGKDYHGPYRRSEMENSLSPGAELETTSGTSDTLTTWRDRGGHQSQR